MWFRLNFDYLLEKVEVPQHKHVKLSTQKILILRVKVLTKYFYVTSNFVWSVEKMLLIIEFDVRKSVPNNLKQSDFSIEAREHYNDRIPLQSVMHCDIFVRTEWISYRSYKIHGFYSNVTTNKMHLGIVKLHI